MAATIDHVSEGRLEFGLGAAGQDLAYPQYGIPFPSTRDRLDMLDESCHIMRSLWSQSRTDFTGRYFQLTEACLSPKPLQPRLPLVIGGDGERRMLRIVARHADIWNALAGTPERYRHKLEVLDAHCVEVGREVGEIRKSVTFRAVLGVNKAEVNERLTQLRRIYPPDSPIWPEFLVFGTPQQCVEALQPYVEMGVDDFLLGARPPVDYRTLDLFAQQVMPILRAAGAARTRRGTMRPHE